MPQTFSIDNADTKEFFDEYGFAIFRNLFSAEEIAKLRKESENLFSQPKVYDGDWDDKPLIKAMRADLFNRYDQFRWAFYKPELQQALTKILGTVGYVPESVLHYLGFGTWHKDTTGQETEGHEFHYAPDCTMVECGIYLQDNSPIYGGGLDVVPGTHKQDKDYFVITKEKSVIRKVISRIQRDRIQAYNTKNCFFIPSKAGDFVFFNKRLNHRGTPCHQRPIPKEAEKHAIFFIGGKRNEHLENYTRYIMRRYDYMKDYKLDEKFVAECKERGIYLVDPQKLLAVPA